MKNFKKIIIYITAFFAPTLSFAQNTSSGSLCTYKYAKSLQGYMCEIYKIVGQYLIPILSLAAMGFFIWNIVQYIRFADNQAKRKEYRQSMIWGVIALFVMVSVWGIVAILGGIVGTETSVIPQIKY